MNKALFVCVHLIIVAYLSDIPRRRLVIKGDSARKQDEIAENSASFFIVLGVQHHHMGPWSSLIQKIIST